MKKILSLLAIAMVVLTAFNTQNCAFTCYSLTYPLSVEDCTDIDAGVISDYEGEDFYAVLEFFHPVQLRWVPVTDAILYEFGTGDCATFIDAISATEPWRLVCQRQIFDPCD